MPAYEYPYGVAKQTVKVSFPAGVDACHAEAVPGAELSPVSQLALACACHVL